MRVPERYYSFSVAWLQTLVVPDFPSWFFRALAWIELLRFVLVCLLNELDYWLVCVFFSCLPSQRACRRASPGDDGVPVKQVENVIVLALLLPHDPLDAEMHNHCVLDGKQEADNDSTVGKDIEIANVLVAAERTEA